MLKQIALHVLFNYHYRVIFVIVQLINVRVLLITQMPNIQRDVGVTEGASEEDRSLSQTAIKVSRCNRYSAIQHVIA